NIDDLHERAGSSNVLHLHGIITRSQSDKNPELTYDIDGWELKMEEKCELGSQLRPHVVWFGEPVPMIEKASLICSQVDIFMIIGTSLQVYPAARLINFAPTVSEKYLIDPKADEMFSKGNIIRIPEKAATGVLKIVENLLQD
ncbi:MAG TPA: NAD-dependent protein deacylase, partial [Sphingobacteriaceae bacterium]|nr:NAD-dependent protein deacylase [Sphingobacteriaceae bacterium]